MPRSGTRPILNKVTGSTQTAADQTFVDEKALEPGLNDAWSSVVKFDDEYAPPPYTMTGNIEYTIDSTNAGTLNGRIDTVVGNGGTITFTGFVIKDSSLTPASNVVTTASGTEYTILFLRRGSISEVYLKTNSLTAADTTPPQASFNPADSDIDIAISTNIIVTFDEGILNTDGSEVTDGNVANLITLKEDNISGADIAFSATINVGKNVITIDPTSDLANSQAVFVQVNNFEDAAGNEETTGQSATFTTVASATFTLSTITPVSGGYGIIDVLATDEMWGDAGKTSSVGPEDFVASNISVGNITSVDIVEARTISGTALAGGETTVRLYLAYVVSGQPGGSDTFRIGVNTNSVFDSGGVAMGDSEVSDLITLPNSNILWAEDFASLDANIWDNSNSAPASYSKSVTGGQFIIEKLDGTTAVPPDNWTKNLIPLKGDFFMAFNYRNTVPLTTLMFLGVGDYDFEAGELVSQNINSIYLQRNTGASFPVNCIIEKNNVNTYTQNSSLPNENQLQSIKIKRVGTTISWEWWDGAAWQTMNSTTETFTEDYWRAGFSLGTGTLATQLLVEWCDLAFTDFSTERPA